MKYLEKYITEKLVIDRKTSKLDQFDNAVSAIENLCGAKEEKDDYKDFIDAIKSWCKKYKIETTRDFNCTAPLDVIKQNWDQYEKKLKDTNWLYKIEQSDLDVFDIVKSKAKLIAKYGMYKKLYEYGNKLIYVWEFLRIYFVFEPKNN